MFSRHFSGTSSAAVRLDQDQPVVSLTPENDLLVRETLSQHSKQRSMVASAYELLEIGAGSIEVIKGKCAIRVNDKAGMAICFMYDSFKTYTGSVNLVVQGSLIPLAAYGRPAAALETAKESFSKGRNAAYATFVQEPWDHLLDPKQPWRPLKQGCEAPVPDEPIDPAVISMMDAWVDIRIRPGSGKGLLSKLPHFEVRPPSHLLGDQPKKEFITIASGFPAVVSYNELKVADNDTRFRRYLWKGAGVIQTWCPTLEETEDHLRGNQFYQPPQERGRITRIIDWRGRRVFEIAAGAAGRE